MDLSLSSTLDSSTSANNPANNSSSDANQERLLPIANISRIMKRVLPSHAKMSREAKSSIQECVTEFIGFITSEASDRLLEDKRKTITGDDIVDSMRALGFDSYMEFLTAYLKKYRASIKQQKPNIQLLQQQQQFFNNNSFNNTSPSSPNTILNNTIISPPPPAAAPGKRGRKSKEELEERALQLESLNNSDTGTLNTSSTGSGRKRSKTLQ